ncbi:MAG: PPOX class F420-dependent oxidoreductase, partial [Actinomycetota bacterium]
MTLDIDEALAWAAGRTPAVLITIKADGSPQSSDVAFAVIDGEIVISITDDRAKTTNIRRDPRVVVHITAPADWSYVAFSGEATLSAVTTDPGDATADLLVEYYEHVTGGPHPDWDEYRAAMIAEKRLIAR